MNQLPPAFLRAWDHDTPAKLLGLAELAGVELNFMPRAIPDHPWVGLEVTFPFPEIGKGKIVKCIIHPYGKLMFDIHFPEPVPPITRGPAIWDNGKIVEDGKFQVNDLPVAAWRQQWQRFMGEELLEILNG